MKVSGALALLFGLATVSACSSVPPPTLYVLEAPVASSLEKTAPTASALEKAAPAGSRQRLAVALGPVTVPDYLDRTDIMRRSSDNRLEFGADERWAEPLRSGLQRLLVAVLADRLGPGYWVTGGSGRSGQIDVEVPVDIDTFEKDAAGRVVLTATWEVRADGRVVRERTGYRRTVTSSGVEDQVRALSADAADLAADLAAAIKAQRP